MSDMAQTNPGPIGIQIDHAEGCLLYDSDGNTYIDLISGISVSSLGHQHPDIQRELHEQIDHHLHVMVYGEVIHSPTVNYAHNLLEDLPLSLNSVYFLNSGSEAIDAAMKLAKRFTRRSTFVSQVQAYHGSGQGPLSLMDDDYFTQRYRPLLNGVYRIKQNDIQAINNLPKQGVAAVIVELIQSERGALLADANFIYGLREYCHVTQSLLVFDEIQSGFYRTGTDYLFRQFDITPDMLIIGKAAGGGLPMGAVITSREIMSAFTNNPILGHITTFGGHPLTARAGNAAFKFLKKNLKVLEISRKESLFKELLVHERIHRVEGRGLLLACHLDESIDIIEFNKLLLGKGVFTDWFLFNMNAIRIAPPLIINEEQIKEVCDAILSSLTEYMN